MSTTAEDISETPSPQGPNLGATDQIAALLTGEDEPEVKDEEEEATPAEASTETDDEEVSNDEAEDDDEDTTLEAVADDDVTWETTLGVDEGKLSFDEEGNPNGVNVNVNGETSTVSMNDLIAGYQTNKALTQKGQSLGDERKVFDGQKQELEQVYASKLESVDALTQHFEKQLIAEFDGVNWEELRVKDPAEYAAMRSDFSAKAGELQSIQQAIITDKEAQNQENFNNQNVATQEYMKGQYDLMIEKNPEWIDEKVRNEAKAEFQTFAKDHYGFTEQEFDTVYDARLIELIKDAKKYHEGSKVAAKKKQKPVPKFQKSRGVVAKNKVSKLDKLTAASRKASGDDKRKLQQSAVAELLMGG